jgi:hypothetical protein
MAYNIFLTEFTAKTLIKEKYYMRLGVTSGIAIKT